MFFRRKSSTSDMIAVAAVLFVGLAQLGCETPAPPVYAPAVRKPGTAKRVCQLTGDSQLTQLAGGQNRSFLQNVPTRNQTASNGGLYGTDLGVSVLHNGATYFYFGDTWGVHKKWDDGQSYFTDRSNWGATDSRAYTTDAGALPAGQCPLLTIPRNDDNEYQETQIAYNPHQVLWWTDWDQLDLGTFNVPTGAVSANGNLYLFYTTGSQFTFDPPHPYAYMYHSVMARSNSNDGGSLTLVYDVSQHAPIANPGLPLTQADLDSDAHDVGKFSQVSAVELKGGLAGLPFSGPAVLFFGASWRYRQSDVYLAAVPESQIEDHSAWRYFTGMSGGNPTWGTDERAASPMLGGGWSITGQPSVGEFSVKWIASLHKWVMMYAGAVFRSSDHPWSGWTGESFAFDVWADGGYCKFMHGFLPVRCQDSCDQSGHCTSSCDPNGFRLCDNPGGNWVGSPDPTGDTARLYCDQNSGVLWKSCDAIADMYSDIGGQKADYPNPGWGGSYGTYMIDADIRPGAKKDTTDIYYTMSTWVPYEIQIMKVTLASITQDKYEPNDSISPSLTQIQPGQSYNASIHQPSDRDFFKLVVSTGLVLNVDSSDLAKGINIQVYDAGGQPTGPSGNGSVTISQPGTYYVSFAGDGADVGYYSFSASYVAQPAPPSLIRLVPPLAPLHVIPKPLPPRALRVR